MCPYFMTINQNFSWYIHIICSLRTGYTNMFQSIQYSLWSKKKKKKSCIWDTYRWNRIIFYFYFFHSQKINLTQNEVRVYMYNNHHCWAVGRHLDFIQFFIQFQYQSVGCYYLQLCFTQIFLITTEYILYIHIFLFTRRYRPYCGV